ncbi:hypothetical protein MXB_1651 [Myxobolus squamalis]|nr:hypothetical protein MXB_1651 [Myxobolus squamalis]
MESNLIEGLKDMSNNSLWRVRLSLVEHIGLIAASINFDATEGGWTTWCNDMLQDEGILVCNILANSVRECTVITILELMKKLSPEWITKFVESRLEFHKNCENYLQRITTIFLLEVITILLSQRVCLETSSLDHFSEVTSMLLRISTDDIDPDVIYFAKKASLCISS